ncbi:anticodon-binding protein [Pterulicium gracile]|uniref:Anticodon-binding protein n=1 Tax=Pterulicium gracile TaxID=1884261 RepID=A0A5C3Q5D3_9AGAR|nr:anticodon-binding protein [Pterula gracilis]
MVSRIEPSSIKNKIKRETESNKRKKAKSKAKLEKRLARAKIEAEDPAAKKERIAKNIPRTLDNTREYDPSFLTADPFTAEEAALDLAAQLVPGPSRQTQGGEECLPETKVLITTSPRSTKLTYDFCDELVGVFPGSEFISRRGKGSKGKGFEVGRIAGWAANRGYSCLMVVNEDMKRPNAITIINLPEGPTAYFKLTSIELTKRIFGHARATPHHPELVLNGFATRLGLSVGKLFQTLFPPIPEFQGRQVVTLHNQRDFLFFRRHRYAFRSLEKVSLQEIGPRFTLKLRSLRKGLPAVTRFGEERDGLEFDDGQVDDGAEDEEAVDAEMVGEDEPKEDDEGALEIHTAGDVKCKGKGKGKAKADGTAIDDDDEQTGPAEEEEWGGVQANEPTEKKDKQSTNKSRSSRRRGGLSSCRMPLGPCFSVGTAACGIPDLLSWCCL